MADMKEYLDFNGLSHYDEKIKSVIDEKDAASLKAAKDYVDGKIGTLDEAYSTVAAAIAGENARATGVEEGLDDRIEALETAIGDNGSVANQIKEAIEKLDATSSQAAGDDGLALSITEVDGKITAISGSIAAETYDAYGAAAAVQGDTTETVKSLSDKITTINGEGEGSIKKAVADGIATVVAEADEDFDTLKEVADWILNDKTGAAALQADVATLKGAETAEGSVANSIKTAIEGLDATVTNKTEASANDIDITVVETDGKLTSVSATLNFTAITNDQIDSLFSKDAD